jgi:hypothetical protein
LPNKVQFELTEHELEFLHKIHNAQAIKEMIDSPGWPLLLTISQAIIGRLETIHLESAARLSRDAYWQQGAELGGARKFAKILTEQVAKEVGVLEQQYVPPDGSIDLADLDGEIN